MNGNLYLRIKRTTDVLLSAFLILIFFPVLILLALVNTTEHGMSFLFFQQRLGKENQPFTIYKFRTIKVNEITPSALGKSYRKWSLDELPQLFNVLKGDMSLIGPRPLLPTYLTKYSEHQIRRHGVRPGMTGWAQVNGRNDVAWEEKFELDVEYVDKLSFVFDLKILWMTVPLLFSSTNPETAHPFNSNPD